MKLLSASVKTFLQALSVSKYNHDKRTAQKRAYTTTCKQAGKRYDPFWHSKYEKNLAKNNQKAEDKRTIRDTFISSI